MIFKAIKYNDFQYSGLGAEMHVSKAEKMLFSIQSYHYVFLIIIIGNMCFTLVIVLISGLLASICNGIYFERVRGLLAKVHQEGVNMCG